MVDGSLNGKLGIITQLALHVIIGPVIPEPHKGASIKTKRKHTTWSFSVISTISLLAELKQFLLKQLFFEIEVNSG